MIFVTVGTDQPFDRLIETVDTWAERTGRRDIFAQVGHGGAKPANIDSASLLSVTDYKRQFSRARLIVAHAGMGTVLTALRYGKPIVIMPRVRKLGEDRTDHQWATAQKLSAMSKAHVAFDETELMLLLEHWDELQPCGQLGDFASSELLTAIREFIGRV